MNVATEYNLPYPVRPATHKARSSEQVELESQSKQAGAASQSVSLPQPRIDKKIQYGILYCFIYL